MNIIYYHIMLTLKCPLSHFKFPSAWVLVCKFSHHAHISSAVWHCCSVSNYNNKMFMAELQSSCYWFVFDMRGETAAHGFC